MRMVSYLILYILIISIVAFVGNAVFVINFKNNPNGFYTSEYTYFIVLVFLCLLGISALFFFDQIKKGGMALYDVLGDSLENIHSIDESEDIRLSIIMDTQLTLRTFFRTGDLPIVPGSNGQATYLVIFIALIAFSIVFYLG